MKKLINDVETVLAESLDGFAAAHADIVSLGAERQFVRRRELKPGKVALISGGGSGHEPLHAGFVRRADQVALQHEVVLQEVGAPDVVGLDAADLGRGDEDVLRLLIRQELKHRTLVLQVEFGMRAQ